MDDAEKIETLRVALRALYQRVAKLEQANGVYRRGQRDQPVTVAGYQQQLGDQQLRSGPTGWALYHGSRRALCARSQ